MLRLKAIAGVVCRVLLIAGCGLATFRSARLAIADWVASTGTPDALERATRYAPNDPRLLSRLAIARSDAGDNSTAVDEELQRVARINPLDSGVLMAIGLREEFRGEKAQAEKDLVRAAEVDHQFKPAWTLANYYARANQPDKAWPMIERILNLEPLGYDPAAVFELCWRETGNDSRRVLGLIPKMGYRPVQYLSFLMATQRTDAAVEAWPKALAAADPGDMYDVTTLAGFADYLANADRVADAVKVWNQLADRGMIQSGRLDPEKGASIADPDFRFPASGTGFEWRIADVPGVLSDAPPGPVRFEINGEEPESFQILSAFAPLVPGKRYRLAWKSDASMLSAPKDPGLSFRIAQGDAVTQCPPLLVLGECDFSSVAGERMQRARIDLGYARALGTTRISGTLQLLEVRLESAP